MGGLDKGCENGAGKRADGVGALGVPLHGEDEVPRRIEFDGFDDAVCRRDRADEQIVADVGEGLVVTGVDLGVLFGERKEPGETGAGCNLDRVRVDYVSTRPVVNGCFENRVEILNEGAVAPDI